MDGGNDFQILFCFSEGTKLERGRRREKKRSGEGLQRRKKMRPRSRSVWVGFSIALHSSRADFGGNSALPQEGAYKRQSSLQGQHSKYCHHLLSKIGRGDFKVTSRGGHSVNHFLSARNRGTVGLGFCRSCSSSSWDGFLISSTFPICRTLPYNHFTICDN